MGAACYGTHTAHAHSILGSFHVRAKLDGYLQADLPQLSRPCGINQVHFISSRDEI